MAQYEHLPIYKAAFDLQIYFEGIVKNFSRYHKYTHGAAVRPPIDKRQPFGYTSPDGGSNDMGNKWNSITRRRFLEAGSAALLGASCASLQTGRTHEPETPSPLESKRPPNFIVILIDDLGYQDVGCFGAPLIRTPRLDKMAAEGVKFTSFLAQPVCTPSRAALMTGCYPMRVGLPRVLFPNAKEGINASEITLAQLLKTRGYATTCIGKWHLGHLPPFLPTRHGFDSYFGIPYSNDMGNTKAGNPPLPLMRNEEIIEQPVDQDTLTKRYTEEAVKFIRENKDRPFFLYLPHTMVHVPLHVSDRFRGKSKQGLYGDAVEEIDWSTGEILDTLASLGLDENTLVIFTSDNGPWLSEGANGGAALPLRAGKGTTFEGGVREPCIMRWPGRIPAGAVCSELATTMDVFPTFARLSGAQVPTNRIIDGKDIWPLMSGAKDAKSPYDALFYYKAESLEAVRSGKWKLILERKGNPVALYDLDADVGESNDLAAAHPDVVKRLKHMAEKCRDDLGDTLTKRKGKNCRPVGAE